MEQIGKSARLVLLRILLLKLAGRYATDFGLNPRAAIEDIFTMANRLHEDNLFDGETP